MVQKRPGIKQGGAMVRHVFYASQTVRSRYHGLGEVTMTGEHPRVRFIDGFERRVPGHTVKWVPSEVYDAEVRNRMMIERYLTFRVEGTWEPHVQQLPRPAFDLATAMKRHAQTPPLPVINSTPPSNVPVHFD